MLCWLLIVLLFFPADIRHSNSKGVPSVITRPGRDTNDWAGDTLDTPHHKSSLLNQYRHHSPHWKLYSAINLSLSKGLGGGKRALCSSAGSGCLAPNVDMFIVIISFSQWNGHPYTAQNRDNANSICIKRSLLKNMANSIILKGVPSNNSTTSCFRLVL